MHYERLLEDAVSFYRSGGGEDRKKPIGLSFMTTHSFAVERLEGDYETRVRAYAERNASLLDMCRRTVRERERIERETDKQRERERERGGTGRTAGRGGAYYARQSL